MKKKLLILVFIATSILANAQLFNIGKFGIGYIYVGPKVGTNLGFNSVDATSGSNKKSNFGYQYGGVGKLGITNKLSIQGEILHTSKGWGENNDNTDYKSRSNYNYLGLPILANYSFLSIGDFDFYGSGGFYSNVMTKGNIKTEYPGFTEEMHVDYNFTKRTEFGLNFGFGTTFPLNNKDRLNIDLRYSFGLTNVETRTNFVTGTQAKKNRTIEISAIYFVDLTRWVHFRGSNKTDDAYDKNVTTPSGKVE